MSATGNSCKNTWKVYLLYHRKLRRIENMILNLRFGTPSVNIKNY